ncbi:hypothetical protein D3C86_2036990 [compost metagenome]
MDQGNLEQIPYRRNGVFRHEARGSKRDDPVLEKLAIFAMIVFRIAIVNAEVAAVRLRRNIADDLRNGDCRVKFPESGYFWR